MLKKTSMAAAVIGTMALALPTLAIAQEPPSAPAPSEAMSKSDSMSKSGDSMSKSSKSMKKHSMHKKKKM